MRIIVHKRHVNHKFPLDTFGTKLIIAEKWMIINAIYSKLSYFLVFPVPLLSSPLSLPFSYPILAYPFLSSSVLSCFALFCLSSLPIKFPLVSSHLISGHETSAAGVPRFISNFDSSLNSVIWRDESRACRCYDWKTTLSLCWRHLNRFFISFDEKLLKCSYLFKVWMIWSLNYKNGRLKGYHNWPMDPHCFFCHFENLGQRQRWGLQWNNWQIT